MINKKEKKKNWPDSDHKVMINKKEKKKNWPDNDHKVMINKKRKKKNLPDSDHKLMINKKKKNLPESDHKVKTKGSEKRDKYSEYREESCLSNSSEWPPADFIYLCVLPHRNWHKVYDPKIDHSGDLGEEKAEYKPKLESCRTLLVIDPLSAMWAVLAQLDMDPNLGPGTYVWLKLKLDSKVQCYTRGTKVSMLQLAHPKVTQPKLVAFRHRVCHWFQYPIRHKWRWCEKLSISNKAL